MTSIIIETTVEMMHNEDSATVLARMKKQTPKERSVGITRQMVKMSFSDSLH